MDIFQISPGSVKFGQLQFGFILFQDYCLTHSSVGYVQAGALQFKSAAVLQLEIGHRVSRLQMYCHLRLVQASIPSHVTTFHHLENIASLVGKFDDIEAIKLLF